MKKEKLKIYREEFPIALFKSPKVGYNWFVICRKITNLGTSRQYSFYNLHQDYLYDTTSSIAEVISGRLSKNNYLIVSGCGMDMIFNTLYVLFTTLYPDLKYQDYCLQYELL